MNLEENVSRIKTKIFESYHKRLTRLGVGKERLVERDPEDNDYKKAKATIEALIEDKGNYQDARNEYLEEISFTLFNRVAGLKVMESKNRKLIPEAIKTRSKYGEKSFSHNAWLEENTNYSQEDLEGIEIFIRYKFDELSREIPLYSSDNLFDLLPEKHDLVDILNMFNVEIKDGEWEQDDILGWLYESYNKKEYKGFKESGDKIEWDKVSLSSQMYTPRWVVEFLANNSLGKYWLEINPNSKIKLTHDIANPPEQPINDKSIEEIKIIDPAAGSGNFLLYSFDLLCEIYEEEGYSKEDIPKLILENNLYGLDLDERAIQIARLQLYIKAKTYNRSLKINNMNIVSANFHLPEFNDIKEQFNLNIDFNDDERKFLSKLWTELKGAHKFGSLLKLDEVVDNYKSILKNNEANYPLMNEFKSEETLEIDVIEKLKNVLSKIEDKNYSLGFLKNQSLDALKFTEIILGVKKEDKDYLVNKYDIALANPPYTDSADYGEELKKFVENNYKEPMSFYKNLYASFLKKNSDLINDKGKIAMINPDTFMFINSFKGTRNFILDNFHLKILVHYPTSGIFNIGVIYPALYIIEKNYFNKKSYFIDLRDKRRDLKSEKDTLQIKLNKIIKGISDNQIKTLNQNELKHIDGKPFIYWISNSFREKFKSIKLGEVLDVKQGLGTSDNLRFLRFHWEVDNKDISKDYCKDKKKWVPYQKGGKYKKWYGNNWLLINWEKEGKELKKFKRSTIRNQNYYFKEGITYTLAGTTGISMRLMRYNNIFDVGGSAIFLDQRYENLYYILGLLNSRIINYIIGCLNPSINSQVGDLVRIPFVKPEKEVELKIENLANENIKEKERQYKYEITEREFDQNPLDLMWDKNYTNIESRVKNYRDFKFNSDCKILLNEAIIDELVFKVYDLTKEDIEMVNKKEGIPVGSLPILEKDKEDYIVLNTESLNAKKLDFIKNLQLEKNRNRKNLKNDIKKLYLNYKSLDYIARELNLNPISVTQIIKEIKEFPQKLTYKLSHELILDNTRQILMDDEDGIAIINEYADEKPLDIRLKDTLTNKNFKVNDLNIIQSYINNDFKNYLYNKFFQDECNTLNLFMFQPKTPYIWHLSSGEEHGFDAFIIIYKWNRDKVFKLKSFYLDKRKTGLKNRMNNLSGDNSANAEKEKDKIRKQLLEIDKFEEKLDELLKSGYDPKLDDGVGKNIAPLQNLGLLSYDVLTKGQLKKFLNADW